MADRIGDSLGDMSSGRHPGDGHRTATTMLLKIATTARPATDLGFLLHKHPGRLQEVILPFGETRVGSGAHVFAAGWIEALLWQCLSHLLGKEAVVFLSERRFRCFARRVQLRFIRRT